MLPPQTDPILPKPQGNHYFEFGVYIRDLGRNRTNGEDIFIYLYLSVGIYDKESVYVIMEAEKSHDLQSEGLRTKRANGQW